MFEDPKTVFFCGCNVLYNVQNEPKIVCKNFCSNQTNKMSNPKGVENGTSFSIFILYILAFAWDFPKLYMYCIPSYFLLIPNWNIELKNYHLGNVMNLDYIFTFWIRKDKLRYIEINSGDNRSYFLRVQSRSITWVGYLVFFRSCNSLLFLQNWVENFKNRQILLKFFLFACHALVKNSFLTNSLWML